MILVDTSVWIDHLSRKEAILAGALESGQVLMHPFVLGEIACGSLANRHQVLRLLANLPTAPKATEEEVLDFIERHSLMGTGIGYIDVHLLAATASSGNARLWTRDKRFAGVALTLQLAWPSPH